MTYHVANKLVISPTSPPSNYNLENSECILEDSSIPTTANSALTKSNGEISAVNISKKDPTYIVSIHHAINDLQTRISDLNKTDIAPTKKHKIVLLGDSHIKGLSAFLNCELNNSYEILSLTKPGANSSILKDSLMESILQLTKNDLLIINFGTNDLETSNYINTFFNIKDYIMNKGHTNILVLNIPLRYDLHNYSQRNLQISELNSKLKQLCSHLTHTAFLHINNDRQLFTSHGLHLNKTSKRLRNYHVALQTLTLFNIQTRTLTPFDSQPPLTVDTPSTYILNTSKNNNNNTTQNTHQSRISK